MILKEWNKSLIWEAKVLINKKYYSCTKAMDKAWDMNYKDIVADIEVDVVELRTLYLEEGLAALKTYTEELIARYK